VGFQDARLALNSQDLVISNVPFAKDGPIDKRYPRLSLHNYFFARALDLVKPGGIVAFITSDSTLDSASSRAAREYLAERADLIGAMRLPNTAFKRNAGTEVTTDVIFLRKRDNSPFVGQRFLRTETTETYDGKPIEVNEYFTANPKMLLGRLSLEGTMYRSDQPALLPTPGADLSAQMAAAAELLPANVLGSAKVADAALAPTADKADKIDGLVFKDGEPKLVNADGTLSDPDWPAAAKKKEQARLYVLLRESLRQLIINQASGNVVAAELEEDRKELNAFYDQYVKKHGPVNARASQFLDDDVDFPMVLALEDGETRMEPTGKGNKQRRVTTWTKSRILRERTIFPREAPTRVDTVSDALQVSLNFRGIVDPEYLSQLTGLPVEAVKAQLEREAIAFENPTSGQWETRAAYLSGMVKAKLAAAKLAAAEDDRFKKHVEELEKVQPAPIAAENIGFKLGSVWIPENVIEQFMADKLAVKARVSFEPITGKWHVVPQSGYYNETNKSLFGVHGWRGDELVAESLNLKSAVVEDDLGDGKKQKNPTKTLEAQAKQDQLQKLFREWAMSSPETAGRLEQIYNERYNGMVPQKFEAPTWAHYPGASEDITLREHQKAVVSRMLQNSTLLAHAVGTGKTYAITTAAMEMRRLGLARKPMIVVQNATLEQFARSFKRLYPAARVLAPNSKQRDAQNRNRTMSRIATGDWDVVIVPQSFINLMPDDPKRETAYIRDEIAKLNDARIAAANSEGKRSPKASDLQKAIDRLEERLKDLANRKVDNVLTFEQLGVDALFVDEAHAYKKLQFATQMDNIKGLDKGASQRGFSMMMKARWIQERNQGRNVIFATGTPVSNTIAEAWTMMRYLRPDLLKEAGIENFDAFASTFGDTVTQLEMTPGGTWKPVTRFAKYTNGPELIAIWRTVADVVTPEEVNLPGLPALKWGKAQAIVVKQSPQIAEYVKFLRARLEEFAAMSGKEKRENSHIPLVVFGLAKKASLDMRMINPDIEDQPGSKLNVAADQIARIWQDSTEANGAQMVFADSFQDDPENPRFNLYTELKRKLIERGIPEGEIVILTADIKDEKRDQIFKRLNDGEIRVALGSTERMGVGVNAQEHLIALHHLDAPPRPMDVEQRNGRIMRQGNLNPEIEIISYGVENTLDAAMFQKLATKQKFINQILRGDIQGRGFEDAANEQSLTFEEQMAAFSGDKRAMEKVGLENQVRQLEALKQGHFNQMRTARETIISLTGRTIPYQTKRVEDAKRLKAEFGAAFDGDTFTLEAGGKRANGRKEVVALLDKVFDRAANDTLAGATKVFGGIEVPVGEMTLNGQGITLEGVARGDNKSGIILPETVAIRWKFKSGGYGGTSRTGMGFFTSLASALERISAEQDQAARSLANEQRNLRELTGFVQQPFAQDAELETAKDKLAKLVAELEAESKAQNSPMQSAEPPGGWTDADKVNPTEAGGLGAQFRDPEKIAELQRQQDQAGFLTLPDFGRLIEAGRKVRLALGEAGKRFSAWSAEMLRRFGTAIEGMLGAVWTRMNWRDLAAKRGVSAEATAALNRIDETAADAGTREKPAAPPVYDPDKLETWWTRAMSASARLRYFGGDGVLKAKRGLELQTAYQAAAVKKQARRLNQQLLDAAYANDPQAQRFPKWVAAMIPPERMRRFLRYALPIAAHLNVTGGAPGAWTFDDFDMRAGFLSEREANKEGVREGDDIYRANPITGEVETLTVGKALKLDDGRRGFQVDRPMPADVQAQIYEAARAEFPEFTWLLDQYVDPALANASEEFNGVRVPAFNRFALATAYRAADPTFVERPAYTPDVSVSGAWGALRRYVRAKSGSVGAALNAGTVSPGRKYDTGESRERGFTQDLISGFNVRAFQVLQEQERKEFRDTILNGSESIPTDGLPEGFVTVDNAFAQLWDAVKVLRRFDDPINFPQTTERVRDDESPEYQQFFGELMKLRGGNKMLPKPLVETLVGDMASQRTDGIMRQMTGWWARNWKAGLLLMPDTFVENRTDNYLRFLMQGYRQMVLSAVRGGDALAFREARKLIAGAFVNVVPGVRQAFDLNRNRLFNQFVEDVMPEEVFGGQTRLVDLGLDQDSAMDKLKRGEVGPAILEASGYGKIDVVAKQQFAFALIQARAEADAKANGLRGEEAEAFAAAYVLNPPQAVRLNAIEAANKALLNYADTPNWLAKFARNPFGNLVVAFPLYRYHFVGREIDRATAAFRAFYNSTMRGKKLTPAQRQAALADTISYVTLPLLGYSFAKVVGALADSVIRDRLPEDDDEREFVGTSNKTDLDPMTGEVRRKALPRELVTANRLNLSAIARQAGVDTGPDDLWWHYKDYPIVRSSALLYQAIEDSRRLGPGQGMKTLFNGTTDLLTSLAGTGQGIKVAGRLSDEMAGEGDGTTALAKLTDPYGARVPTSAYLTLQALNLVPFNRQADEVLKWLDPTRRRITGSKTLGYEPGVAEAVKLGGVSGLAAELTGQREGLPASGPINRKFGFVERPTEISLAQRIAAALGQNVKPVNREQYREALTE
jgi:N12 class adenine-specific DNA methylase